MSHKINYFTNEEILEVYKLMEIFPNLDSNITDPFKYYRNDIHWCIEAVSNSYMESEKNG